MKRHVMEKTLSEELKELYGDSLVKKAKEEKRKMKEIFQYEKAKEYFIKRIPKMKKAAKDGKESFILYRESIFSSYFCDQPPPLVSHLKKLIEESGLSWYVDARSGNLYVYGWVI